MRAKKEVIFVIVPKGNSFKRDNLNQLIRILFRAFEIDTKKESKIFFVHIAFVQYILYHIFFYQLHFPNIINLITLQAPSLFTDTYLQIRLFALVELVRKYNFRVKIVLYSRFKNWVHIDRKHFLFKCSINFNGNFPNVNVTIFNIHNYEQFWFNLSGLENTFIFGMIK